MILELQSGLYIHLADRIEKKKREIFFFYEITETRRVYGSSIAKREEKGVFLMVIICSMYLSIGRGRKRQIMFFSLYEITEMCP